MKKYVYAHPDRDNWKPTVAKAAPEYAKWLKRYKGNEKRAEGMLYQCFQNVPEKHWKRFMKDVREA